MKECLSSSAKNSLLLPPGMTFVLRKGNSFSSSLNKEFLSFSSNKEFLSSNKEFLSSSAKESIFLLWPKQKSVVFAGNKTF